MVHHSTSMSRVEHLSKHFSEPIRDGKDTRDIPHDNFFGICSLLDGKMLNVNVARPSLKTWGCSTC